MPGHGDPGGGTLPAAGYRRGPRRAEPLTSAELISAGVRPQLLVALALRRAAGGRVAKSGDYYFEWGRPTPSYLIGVFEELAGTGLLELAEQDPGGFRRMSLTPAGRLRYEQLSDTLPRAVRHDAGRSSGASRS